jgi:uncharacterized protein Smg (DUF494 family)
MMVKYLSIFLFLFIFIASTGLVNTDAADYDKIEDKLGTVEVEEKGAEESMQWEKQASQEGIGKESYKEDAPTIEELHEKLNLTSEQVEKLRPLMRKNSLECKAIREKYEANASIDKSTMKEDLAAVQRYYDDIYAKILSIEQMQKYQELRREARDNRIGSQRQ